jgi:hypothetical protein
MLFPFILIIIDVLLLVWWLIVFPSFAPVKYSKSPEVAHVLLLWQVTRLGGSPRRMGVG